MFPEDQDGLLKKEEIADRFCGISYIELMATARTHSPADLYDVVSFTIDSFDLETAEKKSIVGLGPLSENKVDLDGKFAGT